MKVIFSERAYTAVLAETLSKRDTETGGVFLGKYIDDVWYIVESIDPGPKSVFQVDYFEYDQPYVQHLINKKRLLYESKLECIGLWHRHPGTFDIFSRTDDGTNLQYALMRTEGAISMLVNLEPRFRFTMYHVSQECTYNRISLYEIGDDLFPEELLEYKDAGQLEDLLNNKKVISTEKMSTEVNEKKNLEDVLKIILPTLSDKYSCMSKRGGIFLSYKENDSEKIATAIASDLLFLSERYGIQFYSTSLKNKIIVDQGSGSDKTELIFTYSKKDSSVLVTYLENTFYYEDGLFERLIRKAIENEI